jgi:uncharacterized protein (TIGR02466 family)
MLNYVFGSSVFYGEVDDKEVLKKYKNKILNEEYSKFIPVWNCKVYSSFMKNEYNQNFFGSDIRELIIKNSSYYAYNLGLNSNKINFELSELWWNLYEDNSYQDAHIHHSSHISGVLYLTDSNQPTTIYSPNEYFNLIDIRQFVREDSLETREEFNIDCKENHILMFRSYLRHSVIKKHFTSKEPRITIAFNIRFKEK